MFLICFVGNSWTGWNEELLAIARCLLWQPLQLKENHVFSFTLYKMASKKSVRKQLGNSPSYIPALLAIFFIYISFGLSWNNRILDPRFLNARDVHYLAFLTERKILLRTSNTVLYAVMQFGIPACYFPRRSGYVKSNETASGVVLESYPNVSNPYGDNISPILFKYSKIGSTINVRIGPEKRWVLLHLIALRILRFLQISGAFLHLNISLQKRVEQRGVLSRRCFPVTTDCYGLGAQVRTCEAISTSPRKLNQLSLTGESRC